MTTYLKHLQSENTCNIRPQNVSLYNKYKQQLKITLSIIEAMAILVCLPIRRCINWSVGNVSYILPLFICCVPPQDSVKMNTVITNPNGSEILSVTRFLNMRGPSAFEIHQ